MLYGKSTSWGVEAVEALKEEGVQAGVSRVESNLILADVLMPHWLRKRRMWLVERQRSGGFDDCLISNESSIRAETLSSSHDASVCSGHQGRKSAGRGPMSSPDYDKWQAGDNTRSMRIVAKVNETGEGKEASSIIDEEQCDPDSGAYRHEAADEPVLADSGVGNVLARCDSFECAQIAIVCAE